MSVLIKGMEMPKKGFLEIVINEDGTVQITGKSIEYDGKYYYTPADNFGAIVGSAIEVPPHSRLIEEPKSYDYSGLVHISSDDYVGIAKYFAEQVHNQPTVIEEDDGRV